MLLKNKTAPQNRWLLQKAPESITPYSLTLILAYLQYYTPKRLKNGRFLTVKHLRNLADWINHPAPKVRSLKQHKILAMHLTLLRAANFISAQSINLVPQPTIAHWLHTTQQETIDTLLQAVNDTKRWQQACTDLGLTNVVGPDGRAYIQQSLARQYTQPKPESPQNLHWLHTEQEDTWQLHIPTTLPLWLHFDLRQLGNWTPTTNLTCTPLTIAATIHRGYSLETIQWLLETASQEKLPPAQKKQLRQWTQRANAYKLRTVHLLSTSQPDQMAALLRQKRMRNHVIQHLSPRHAIVSKNILPQLEKWLTAQQVPLNHQAITQKDSTQPPLSTPLAEQTAVQWSEQTAVQWSEQTAVQWLGIRLLSGLSEITHQPIPSPHNLLDHLDAQLEPTTKTELEAIAANMLNSLRAAIRGRDAFLPASQPVPQETITLIKQSIWNETSLQIHYQPLGSRRPSWREIQPLRLEQRGTLYYLYAYCLRAETNLTFRLDRIHD